METVLRQETLEDNRPSTVPFPEFSCDIHSSLVGGFERFLSTVGQLDRMVAEALSLPDTDGVDFVEMTDRALDLSAA
ncbi:UNVERIFIED_CONTAM: hypothetical protein K2H54_031745 [Gekko kuhli]